MSNSYYSTLIILYVKGGEGSGQCENIVCFDSEEEVKQFVVDVCFDNIEKRGDSGDMGMTCETFKEIIKEKSAVDCVNYINNINTLNINIVGSIGRTLINIERII